MGAEELELKDTGMMLKNIGLKRKLKHMYMQKLKEISTTIRVAVHQKMKLIESAGELTEAAVQMGLPLLILPKIIKTVIVQGHERKNHLRKRVVEATQSTINIGETLGVLVDILVTVVQKKNVEKLRERSVDTGTETFYHLPN